MSRRPPVTAAQQAQILALYAQGYSYRQVGEALDVNGDTARRVVVTQGTPRTRAEGLALYNQSISDETRAKLAEAGRRGAAAAKERVPASHWSRIGSLGGSATRDRHDADYYARIGRKGGSTTSARHGPAHYERMARLGGARMKELIARGKALEEQEHEHRD